MTVQQPVGMANHPVVTIKLASTSDELMQCYMLRAAVFMGEQHCPYWRGVRRQRLHREPRHHVCRRRACRRPCGCAGSSRSPSSSAASSCERYRSLGLYPAFMRWARSSPGARATPRPTCICQRRLWPIIEREGFRRGRRQDLPLLRSRVRRLRLRPRAGERRGQPRHRSHGAEPAGRPPGHAGHPGEVDGARRLQSACGADRTSRELRRVR